jgi:hypothetical protein
MREQISLPDHPRLIRELRGLERMERDSVTNPPGGHDDYVNALAGCLRVAHARPNKAYWATYAGGF